MGDKYALGSLPYFMKIISRMAITKDYASYLPFPKEFVQQQARRIEKEVTVKMARKKWQMKVASVKNGTLAFRGAGWCQFTNDNNLEIGDQVVFTMLSGSLFTVKIVKLDGTPVPPPPVVVKQEVDDEGFAPPSVEPLRPLVPDTEEMIDETPQKEDEGFFKSKSLEELQTPVETPRATTPGEEEARTTPATTPAKRFMASPPAEEESLRKKKVKPDVERPEANGGGGGEEEEESDGTPPAAAAEVAEEKRAAGSEQDPVVIDLSGESKSAGIHILLRTEDRKEYKVFISATAVESVASSTPPPPESEPEPEPELEPELEVPVPLNMMAPVEDEHGEFRSSQNPSITIPIKITNLAPYFRLQIEKAFAKKWMPQDGCNMRVEDFSGNEWAMKWVVGPKCMLTSGWSSLAKHYNLKIGDQCTLEVVGPSSVRVSSLVDTAGKPMAKKIYYEQS